MVLVWGATIVQTAYGLGFWVWGLGFGVYNLGYLVLTVTQNFVSMNGLEIGENTMRDQCQPAVYVHPFSLSYHKADLKAQDHVKDMQMRMSGRDGCPYM